MELNRVSRVDDRVPLRRALVSVADKRGIDAFVRELWNVAPDLVVYSSGGTYRVLRDAAETVGRSDQIHEIAEYTGQPEMQGGLVKTLDYRIYLGILSERYNEAHQRDVERTNAESFDLTVCNFYPFEEAASGESVTIEDLRTHIDIGGPTMLRASAKNFLRVAAVCDTDDYERLLEEIRGNDGATTLAFRANLAAKAFRYTAHYETAIAGAVGSFVRSTNWSEVYEMEENA